MRNVLLKNSLKQIKNTRRRFISILVMALLGVGFFAGLYATGPDMKESLDKYLDDTNTYDISIISTLGLTNDDILELKKIEGLEESYGIKEKDAEIKIGEKEYVANFIDYNQNLNSPVLVEGNMPQSSLECAIDQRFSKMYKCKVGDKISIKDDDDNFKNDELTIAGIIESPLYISSDKGTTKLGAGSINCVSYSLNNIDTDYYSSIGIKVNGAKELQTDTKKYNEIIENSKEQIEKIKEERQNARYNELKNKASKELDKAKKEFNSEKKKGQDKISKAEKQITNAKKQIQEAKKQLKLGKKEYNSNTIKANSAIKQIEDTLIKLGEQKKYLESIGLDTTQVVSTINSLKDQQVKIKTNLKTGKQEISNAEKEISKNEKEIIKAEEKLKKSKKEFDDKIKEAEEKIKDAEKEIDKIKVAKWYVLDRKGNNGYNNVTQAVTSIVNLSKIFPILFYVIAVLISLTSMTRMVEEERIEIGTLKALGYSNTKIIFKYILYAMLATIIGGIIGMLIGLKLLPNIVWTMYALLYYLPSFEAKLKIGYGILGIIIAFICIGGATFVVSYKELRNMPAVLMRPKAPKNGKRVFLEKINFLWRRLTFSQKVTVRNLFRYKKRVLMTIIGIAGCTALILAGFGIKDSITDIVHNQFERINKYDISLTINSDEDISNLIKDLDRKEQIEDRAEINIQTGKLSANGIKKDVKITVPKEKEELQKVINLVDKKTKTNIELSNNGIIITDKVAQLLKVNKGDNITLIDNNDIEYNFKVDGIVENYVDHYVYMSKDLYEKEMKETYKTNMILINTSNLSETESLAKELVNYKEISGINLSKNIIVMVEDMLSLLDYVVIILIISAALLAFVVLYNLANVNISERRREIATLKVLGFYDKEVDNYINKESIILTILGIALGLVLGYLLTQFLVTTCEIEMLRFGRKIGVLSYVYSGIITSIFTFIVNNIIHFSLKKIDMIDSLKSIE